MLPIYLIKYAWKGMISPKKVLKPKSFVYDTSLMNTLDIYGAFDNHLLIGIIGVHQMCIRDSSHNMDAVEGK